MQKVRHLQSQLRRRDQKITDIESMTKDLQEKNLIDSNTSKFLEELPGPCKGLIKRMFENKRGKSIIRKFDDEELKTFAIGLDFRSPLAYR